MEEFKKQGIALFAVETDADGSIVPILHQYGMADSLEAARQKAEALSCQWHDNAIIWRHPASKGDKDLSWEQNGANKIVKTILLAVWRDPKDWDPVRGTKRLRFFVVEDYEETKEKRLQNRFKITGTTRLTIMS